MTTYTGYIALLKKFFNYDPSGNLNKIENTKKKMRKSKYIKKIKNIIHQRCDIFEFEVTDFSEKNFPEELKWVFLSNTQRFLKILKEAVDQMIQEIHSTVSFFSKKKIFWQKIENGKEKTKNLKELFDLRKKTFICFYQIVIKPLLNEYCDSIQFIGANFIGKFVSIEGYITDLSLVKILIKKAVHICMLCNTQTEQNLKHGEFKPFFRCPQRACNRGKYENGLYLDTNETHFEKYQELIISHKFDKQSIVSPFHTLKIKLFGSLVKPFIIGERVKVCGTLLPDHILLKKTQNYTEKIIVEAFFVKKIKSIFPGKNKTADIEEEILKIHKNGNSYKQISSSIAPFIYGNNDLKKALLLSLISSHQSKSSSFATFNQNINICIISDIGPAKTKLLKFISDIASQGIYENAENHMNFDFFSGKIHKKEINKIKNRYQHNILYGDRFLCIDELEKIREKDMLLINNTLENKWSRSPEKVSADFKKFSTIVGAVTLKEYLFEQNKHNSKQTKIFNFFFQFDLIFLISNSTKSRLDKHHAKRVLCSYRYNPPLSFDSKSIKKQILKSYIIEAQKNRPTISERLINFLTYNYAVWRAFSREDLKNPINVRSILLIVCLSFSLARLRFQNFISRYDIKESIRLINASKKSYYKTPIIYDSISEFSLENRIYTLIRDFLVRKKKADVNLNLIEKFVLKKGFTRENFVACLSHFENLKIWTISLDQGKLIFIN